MKNRNLLSIKKLAVLGICVSFVAGGCGKMTESSIPELEEPVALNEAYRPVEYGTIGSMQVLMATAVPRDYCNYYSANVNISQIYVELGDTVNVGDVLAVCDVDEAKKQLQECNDALAHENETYEISAQISDTQIKLWESQAADTDEFSTEQIEKKESTEEDYNTQIATEQENQRYDKQLHEYRVQKINEQMALYQQIVDDGTLKAAHSGLVTYTKKLTDGRSAAAYENIVIVHITGNTDSGYGNAAFYIKLDNGIPDDLTRASAVKFSYVSFKKVVVVPTSIIHKQVNPMDKDDISYYVWKIDGDSVVKQPVILGDYTSGSNTLVLYGIDEGDEICLAS